MIIYDKSVIKRVKNRITAYGFDFIYWVAYYAILKSAIVLNSIKYFVIRRNIRGELTAKVDGHIMYLNPKDDGISRELLLNQNREELSQVMLKEIRPDETVVDIGANIGYYALKEARIVAERGHLFAIEPVKENIYWLKKNLEANNYMTARVERLAMGDKDGEIEMNICEKSNLHSVLERPDHKTLSKEKVAMMTVDSFSEKYGITPTFLRMDVEGYEYEIMQGATKTLQNSKNLKMMIEFHPVLMGDEKSAKFLKLLKKNGFETRYVVFDNPLYPYIRPNTFFFWLLLRLESKFMKRKNGYLLGKAHENISIEELINNKEILSGALGWPHILFKKASK